MSWRLRPPPRQRRCPALTCASFCRGDPARVRRPRKGSVLCCHACASPSCACEAYRPRLERSSCSRTRTQGTAREGCFTWCNGSRARAVSFLLEVLGNIRLDKDKMGTTFCQVIEEPEKTLSSSRSFFLFKAEFVEVRLDKKPSQPCTSVSKREHRSAYA